MPNDSRMNDELAEHRRMIGPPEDRDDLTAVVRGEDRFGTWEMRDGPHPMPQDPDAIRHELISWRSGSGGGIGGGAGPRLGAREIGRIGTSAGKGRDYRIGYIEACCQPVVASVRVQFDDGSIYDVSTSLSAATGLRWAVCPLDSAEVAYRVEFLDEQGTVLDSKPVRDPRIDL